MGGVSSQKQKVDTYDEEDDVQIYENGNMFPDIDPIDGTHYRQPDLEDTEVYDPGCRSNIDHETINPLDSALSDGKSTTSTRPRLPGRFKDQSYFTYVDNRSHTNLVGASHSRQCQPRRHKRRSKRRSVNGYSWETPDCSYETKQGSMYESQRCIMSGLTDGYSYGSRYGSAYGSRYGSTYGWRRIREAPMDRVVFLLDAFEPLIAGSVNVMEILPHLEFIDDTETFRVKKCESPREAVLLLIKRLKESDEPGRWQAFLEALKAEGYVYIANLLLEQTESDHSTNRRILRLFTPELISRIDPEEFIDHLLAEEVISDADREQIQCEKTNRGNIAASLMLLERVPSRLENWFDIFLGVLEKCGLDDLIENFRVPVVSVESCKVQDKDSYGYGGYRTPFNDKPKHDSSSPKLNKHADHHPTETDQHIINIRKENEILSKALEKEREKYKLLEDNYKMKRELHSLKEEMSHTYQRHANQQRHTVMNSAPKNEKSVMSFLTIVSNGL